MSKPCPERVDYRVLVEPDGNDGEVYYVMQAFYRPDEALPFMLSGPVPGAGSHVDDLRGDLRGMLAATDRPALIRDQQGRISEVG